MDSKSLTRVRTDLALEAKNSISEDNSAIKGVRVTEEKDCKNNINIIRMDVLNRNGAQIIGRPVGTYITMEAPNPAVPDEGYHREVSVKMAECVEKLLKGKWKKRIDIEHI